MIWAEFVFSAIVIVLAAVKLAAYGDVIALRTKLGGMFVGTLLLAGATSLPELLTSINAIDQNVPNLTVGNIFGSCMFNMFLLALLDLLYRRLRVLRRIAVAHAITASMAVLLNGIAVFFILAQLDLKIGWVGLDSLTMMVLYVAGTRVLFSGNQSSTPEPSPSPSVAPGVMSLRRGVLGFIGATVVLVLIMPLLVSSSIGIAEKTGMSTGFVGIALVGVITSLPEAVTMIAAARIGAYDLAVGNLFGSNIFNIFALGLTDVFYTEGRFLSAVNMNMMLAGLIALLLTNLALVGNLARHMARGETRRMIIEFDALLIMIVYLFGMWFLYSRGLMG